MSSSPSGDRDRELEIENVTEIKNVTEIGNELEIERNIEYR